MKKQIFLLLVSAIAYCSCTKSPAQSLCDGETGASPKDIQTQKVTVGDFNAISATSSVDVVYIPSEDETSVEIRASKAVLPYISVQVDAHGTLVVGMKKPKDPTKTKGIKEVHVKARPVGSLSASSSGDIFVKDGLHVKGDLRLTAAVTSRAKTSVAKTCTPHPTAAVTYQASPFPAASSLRPPTAAATSISVVQNANRPTCNATVAGICTSKGWSARI